VQAMITSLLGSIGMTINFSIIYLGTQIPILLFLFWFIYVIYFLELVERFNGLIGELIRLVVMILYLYFAFTPFATMILIVSISNAVDISLSINFFYLSLFLMIIAILNQIFKTYIQILKYNEKKSSDISITSSKEKKVDKEPTMTSADNKTTTTKPDSGSLFKIETPNENTTIVQKQNESPKSSVMQVILSYLFWGFGLYWIGGLFGFPNITMLTIPLLSLIPGIPTFDANVTLAMNNLIFFVTGFIVFIILYEIFAPKKSK
jgi:hypothetical protein